MKTIWKILMGGLILLSVSVINYKCSKDNGTQTGKVALYLTDAPAVYDAVNIDLQSIVIKSDASNDEKTLKLQRTGIYNLLNFSNGLDTLLGSIQLPIGNISQIRLVLGSNSNLVIGGQTIALKVPSGSESGLKLNLNENIKEGLTYKLWIDFDASRSIVKQENDKYSLKPTLRLFSEATSGTIKGSVSPIDAKPFIWAVNGTDTIGSIATIDGSFLLKGVPAGTYSITLSPQNGLSVLKVNNIVVTIGNTTDVGKLTLQ